MREKHALVVERVADLAPPVGVFLSPDQFLELVVLLLLLHLLRVDRVADVVVFFVPVKRNLPCPHKNLLV